jgi:HEAT repeat protein
MLVRRAGTARAVPVVKQLLKHPDAKVRLEVLAVLLRFKDPAAVGLVRREILSKDPDVSSQAVYLVGQYRVTEVVEYLCGLIKKVVFFESDYAVNEELVRALGEIGDPRAIPDIENLARSSFSLHPASHARMKRTIFESLERYPRESIGGLLKIGARSDEEAIRKACSQLAARR